MTSRVPADCAGRNKLIINHLGKLFVTSDAATIIREIEVAHPAAKLLVMASTAQETEVGRGRAVSFPHLSRRPMVPSVLKCPKQWPGIHNDLANPQMGDATNLVLIFAGELLKRSEHLLTMGLHPSDVIQGYEMALAKAQEELSCAQRRTRIRRTCLPTALVTSVIPSTPLPSSSQLAAAISPALASKQPGSEHFLAALVAEAALAVMPKQPRDFNVDSVRVVKVLGGGLDASRVVRGMVFGREAEGEPIC